jgi:siderophore synthetase component
MRIDPDTCRDPDLLAAEVRRLQGVIAAGEATLTDEEREVLGRAADDAGYRAMEWTERVVRGLLERLS